MIQVAQFLDQLEAYGGPPLSRIPVSFRVVLVEECVLQPDLTSNERVEALTMMGTAVVGHVLQPAHPCHGCNHS